MSDYSDPRDVSCSGLSFGEHSKWEPTRKPSSFFGPDSSFQGGCLAEHMVVNRTWRAREVVASRWNMAHLAANSGANNLAVDPDGTFLMSFSCKGVS